jgi:hypothetical protein
LREFLIQGDDLLGFLSILLSIRIYLLLEFIDCTLPLANCSNTLIQLLLNLLLLGEHLRVLQFQESMAIIQECVFLLRVLECGLTVLVRVQGGLALKLRLCECNTKALTSLFTLLQPIKDLTVVLLQSRTLCLHVLDDTLLLGDLHA